MTGVLTTKISFVSGQASGLVQTGDILMILACILAAIAAVTTFVLLRKFKKATANATSSDVITFKTFFVEKKPLAITACVSLFLAIVLCVAANVLSASPAFADETNENGVQAAETVKAKVDETGRVSIENGFIKNQNSYAQLHISKTSVKSDASMANATWSIKLKDQELYGTHAGSDKDASIDLEKNSDNPVNFAVDGLDAQTAKSLVGKTPITVSFTYNVVQLKTTIEGHLSINQNEKQKAIRPITAENQPITFFDEGQQKYTTNTDSNGNYKIEDVPHGTKGQITTNIIGCKIQSPSNANTQDRKIYIGDPIDGALRNQDFVFDGPEFDYYTLDELKIASNDIAAKAQASQYNNEFMAYMQNDAIWWSNSNGQQPNTCTGQDCASANADFCNQNYKCNFDCADADAQKFANPLNQFLFLRVIGLNQDAKSDGAKAGLTLQAISALPNVYAYGPNDIENPGGAWDPEREFGRFWGDENCTLRNNMNDDTGSIYGKLADAYKQNIVPVVKSSQRYHKWDNTESDIVKTQDKLFITSYTEMCTPGSENSAFKNFKWYHNAAEGAQYQWYKNHNISGNTGNKVLSQLGKTNNGYTQELGWNPWLRSVYHKTDQNMMFMDSEDGTIYKDVSFENQFSVVPTFCL